MRISYRAQPVLGMINGINHSVKINPDVKNKENILSSMGKVFKDKKTELLDNVIIISESFFNAASECSDKMISAGLYKEIGSELTGVLICGHSSIVYYAKRITIDENEGWELNIMQFYAGNALATYVWDDVRYTDNSLMADVGLENETPSEAARNIWFAIQMILLFKKYAQVEIKQLPAGQKVRTVECSYKNDTNINITHLDSKWFTTLVKSDAFKVRGHFRLQPKKKDGEWTKELIWINDFQKEGYTAPAKKLNQE